MKSKTARERKAPADANTITVTLPPEVMALLRKDAERCLRTPEQQTDAILSAYFGESVDIEIGGALVDEKISLLRVFNNLADAINAVSDHPDTPQNINRPLSLAVDEINNHYHEDIPPDYVNRVLQRAAKMAARKAGDTDDD